MPYLFIKNKKKIPRHLDRRVKVSQEKREEIKNLYHFERLAQREIARRTGVSRRMIGFILFPERLEVVKAQFKERRKDGRYYYGKEKWRETMKEHRHYKQSIKNELV